MNKDTKILVTGGAGYIGSHCILKLIELGFNNVISVDNFCNSTETELQKIEYYTGKAIHNENIDIKDGQTVKEFFRSHPDITTIVHFAALKDPFESIKHAAAYYENNVGGLINLIKYSDLTAVDKIVFSSSCAVYGEPISIPVDENHPINPLNPYANSKWICENILRDTAKERKLKIISLRYFNPIGSNARAGLKEFYTPKSGNIIPQIIKVIRGEIESLAIYGDDLPTKDGTGVRDYIHVKDLVDAHIASLELLAKKSNSNFYEVYNVGTGEGISVQELLREFELQLQRKIPTITLDARAKEVPQIFSDVSRIRNDFSWYAKSSLHQIVKDTIKSHELL